MIDIEALADSGELFDKYYLLLRPINTEGGTADVWLALDVRTVKDKKILKEAPLLEEDYLATKGLLVAIKVYRPKNALDIEGETKFLDEFAIVYNCRHSNLITPTSFSIFEEIPYLVLPYCKKGSSELFLGNMTSNDDIWKYISDVASGLAYLHHCNPPIIHQDIKPANVLIDDFNNYAITDFGISEKYDSQDEENNDDEEKSGTSAYMSPERFDPESEPSEAGDIWAFGATLYELISGHVPFGEDGGNSQPDGKVNLKFPKEISSDIQKLICTCLDKDTTKRPTAEMLVKVAQEKKYQIGSPLWKKLFLAVCFSTVLAGCVFWFLNTQSVSGDITPRDSLSVQSLEKEYGEAMLWMNTNCTDSLKIGIEKLEKIAEANYIPAIYELALTYGWDNTERSINRKNLLGIELGNPNVDVEGQCMPVSEAINDKAIHYFIKIVKDLNPAYVEKNVQSAIHLGNYYWYYKKDKKKAVIYFKSAQKEVRKLPDSEYIKKVNEMTNYYINSKL